jgi:hypothetical protein
MRTLLMLVFLQQESPVVQVFIPTSDAIDVARRVARDLGYPINKYAGLYFFDQLTTEVGKPPLPGYVSIGFYGNNHLLNEFDINEKTGQIVDRRTCEVFEYADLKAFQRAQQQSSGSKPKTPEELMNEIGCDQLTVVRKRALGKKSVRR